MRVGILHLGKADDIVTRSTGGIVAQKSQHLWTGGISPAARMASDPHLARRIAAALEPHVLESYFVASDFAAHTRCIDGRIIEGYAEDLALHGRPLGAQVPGGTAISALTRRIVHAGGSITAAASFTDDLEEIISVLQRKHLSFGGHVDNANHPHGDTGCGAIDKIPEVLAILANPRTQRQVRGVTEKLLGIRYDDAYVDAILGRVINLQSIAERYFMVDQKTGTYAYKRKIIDDLRKKGDKVSRLVGPHFEVGLVVNTVPGTTFDTDRFSLDNGNELQLFNYDFWFTLYVANLVYPVGHEVSFATAKLNLRLQHEYVLCRTLLAVAVLMVLTDGSVELLVRK
jgi:hypothetical protein